MNFALTWDLLIIIFTAIVVTYSLIIGRNEATKMIVAAYIASVATQGIGMAIGLGLKTSEPLLTTVGLPTGTEALFVLKLITFVTLIITIMIQTGISFDHDEGGILDTTAAGILGAATAIFLLMNLLTFLAHRPLLDPSLVLAPPLQGILHQSQVTSILCNYQYVWLTLPALLFILASFLRKE